MFWMFSHPDGRSSGTHTIWLSNDPKPGANEFEIITNVAGMNGLQYQYFVPHLGDFNGDGKTDIFWLYSHPDGRSSGTSSIWLTNEIGNGANDFVIVNNVANQNGAAWQYFRPLLADFNGDGKTDFFWMHSHPDGRSSGTHAIWLTEEIGPTSNQFEILHNLANRNGSHYQLYIPSLGDFDGDGKADVFWMYAQANGASAGNNQIWRTSEIGNGVNQFDIIDNVAGQNSPHWVDFRPSFGDFNGDGQTDILWVHSDANGHATGINKIWLTKHASSGFNEFELIANVANQNRTTTTPTPPFLPSLADFNGDGKTDIFWTQVRLDGRSQGTNIAWLAEDVGGGANAFEIISNVAGQNGPAYEYFLTSLGDFNGDGKSDVFWTFSHPDGRSSGTHRLWVAQNSASGRVLSISNGLGSTSHIEYASLSEKDAPYTKDSGAVYPEMDLQAPMYVVSELRADDGIGGVTTTRYRYGGLKYDHERRQTLGFRWREVEQVEAEVVKRTEYRQDFPFTGMTALSETRVLALDALGNPQGQAGTNLVRQSSSTYECEDFVGANGCVVAVGSRYFAHQKTSTEKGWDLDGTALPETETTSTYDDYGNALTVNVKVTDPVTLEVFEKNTVNAYAAPNVPDWIHGRLERAEVTSISP